MNKWFSLQATAPAHDGEPPALERVKVLLRHSAYSEKNPNNVNSLVLGFCNGNPAEFHRPDGSGYFFWIDQVLRLDRINPIVAARVARTLERWRRYTPDRSAQMRRASRKLVATAAFPAMCARSWIMPWQTEPAPKARRLVRAGTHFLIRRERTSGMDANLRPLLETGPVR